MRRGNSIAFVRVDYDENFEWLGGVRIRQLVFAMSRAGRQSNKMYMDARHVRRDHVSVYGGPC